MSEMKHHSAGRAAFDQIRVRFSGAWRRWSESRALARELEGASPRDLDRTLADAGLQSDDLPQVLAAADLATSPVATMMRRLDVSAERLRQCGATERELQRVCLACPANHTCTRPHADGRAGNYRSYCLNAWAFDRAVQQRSCA